MAARQIQLKRFDGTGIISNAFMNHKHIKHYCGLNKECEQLMKMAIDELHLSARAYDKILKVARTVSDLTRSTDILPEHIAEAIGYRSLDRNYFG